MMLAVQRRRSSAEKQGDDTLWNGLRVLEESYTPGFRSNGNPQRLNDENSAKNVPKSRDQESPPVKLDEVHGATSQNEQHMHPQVLQEPATTSKYPCQKVTSSHVKPSGHIQKGWQNASCGRRRTSSCPARTESLKELAHMSSKAGEKQQEGPKPVAAQAEHLANPEQMRMRNDSLNGSAVLSLATGSLRSLRRRKPQPWPNPKDSLGDMIDANNKKIKGKVWIAEGPALELFETQVRPEIEKLLHSTEPPQCAPLFLPIYMIGKAEVSASPIIMICCYDRKVRKDAEAIIRQSDILQKFPQMGLGSCATLLETTSPLVPVTEGPTESHVDDPISSKFEIHGSQKPVMGRRLKLVEKFRGGETVRFATGGPFVQIEKQIYQLTAFHYGKGVLDIGPATELDSDPDECEYDGQSDTEEDESDLEEENTGGISLKEECNTSLENQPQPFPCAYETDVVLEQHDQQNPWSRRTLPNCISIDYFLVKLPTAEASRATNVISDFQKRPPIHVKDIGSLPLPGTQVVVITSYNLLSGTTLPGSKRVKMRHFHGFQDLLIARLSCSIKPGDSGSAVVDVSTGCFYGHIILGSAPDTIVYIVPSVDTFTNVVAISGKLPTLKFVSAVMI